jgi:UDP-glucose 4-epimerase
LLGINFNLSIFIVIEHQVIIGKDGGISVLAILLVYVQLCLLTKRNCHCKMQSILVSGGAGFIGRHLINKLSKEKDYRKVIIIDNLSNAQPFLNKVISSNTEPEIKFYKADIRRKRTISDIIKREKIDACIHLAARMSVEESVRKPQQVVNVNIQGTLSMLEACSQNNVKTFVFASSAAVYGHAKELLPIPEDHVLEPLSPYGATKVAGESLVNAYKNCGRIGNTIVLRFFNVYGEGQSKEYAGVITNFANRLSAGLPPVIYGDGRQTRDFVSVDDITNILIAATIQAEQTGLSCTLNVGTGSPVTINELARKMIRIFGLDNIEPIYQEANKGDIFFSLADTSRLKHILKTEAKTNIEYELAKIATGSNKQEPTTTSYSKLRLLANGKRKNV